MFHVLRRHPVPICAHFEHCLVLTYAWPAEVLRPLLPPGLELDTWGEELGFVAVALVQTRSLRPVGFPPSLGQDFFLSGYRIFTRFVTPAGQHLRGLRILRSDTNRRRMAVAGNLLTHYNYRLADVSLRLAEKRMEISIRTPNREADLDVAADLAGGDQPLPADSCFANEHDARRFAGPLPYTFDYESETHSIIAIQGRRQAWHPQLVKVDVQQITFFEHPPFTSGQPRLVSAFHVADIPYRWDRGVRYALDHSGRGSAR